MIEDFVALLELDDRAAGLEHENVAAGFLRDLEDTGSQRPVLAVELDHRAAGEARQVRGKIVGGGFPQRRIQEIRARIVRIGIGIENVANRNPADR